MVIRGLGLAALAFLFASADSHAAACEDLREVALPNTTITLAQPVAAGAFSPPQAAPAAAVFDRLPAFCRVAATLTPSADSDIRIEVWMPLAGWNGKFQAVGNGGFAGSITYTAGTDAIERGMAEALRRGYATASTDTGHTGSTTASFLGHPEKFVDFGYRAVHEMTVVAKALVKAFYGAAPTFSYWNGCSLGGRQGLMEALRFPSDYDGIIAGAPGNPQWRLSTWNVYVAHAALSEPLNAIPPSKYPAIHRAVVNACDLADGLRDGLISEPNSCRFDVQSLACTAGDADTCLTAGQVQTARTVTMPARHPRTGDVFFPGLAFGTELGWSTKVGGPQPNPLGTDYFKYVVYKDPNWDWRGFDLESALAAAERADGGLTDATNPDLLAFRSRGGKLLLYHGLADQNFSAQITIDYYQQVVDRTGAAGARDWVRLFLAPAVGHCGGGEGPNVFDPVSALEGWVEHGNVPESIPASRIVNGAVTRTRPLCAYPRAAAYKGSGSIDDAGNFVCK